MSIAMFNYWYHELLRFGTEVLHMRLEHISDGNSLRHKCSAGICYSPQDNLSSAKSHEDMSGEICGAVSGWLSVKLRQSLLPSGATTAWK
jgi:hypothetical protein